MAGEQKKQRTKTMKKLQVDEHHEQLNSINVWME